MLELETGQKIRINFSTTAHTDIGISCVVKWFEKDRAGLVFPKDKEEFIKDLPEGKEIEAILYTNSGIFVFDSIVINSPLEHDFVVELPEEKKQIQRREYIRAPINLKLTMKKGDIQYTTNTINVGGGGIRFFANDDLKTSDKWKFALSLPEDKLVQGIGEVLYTFLQGRKIVSVITFYEINETDRNRIIKLCLDEEIKNLKFKRPN